MTLTQEDALYEFLDKQKKPFDLKDAALYVRSRDSKRSSYLPSEIGALIDSRRLAFKLGEDRWISRCGVFTGARFPVRPSRFELRNGLLVPGHRFIPFANQDLSPKDYKLVYGGEVVETSIFDGSWEDFYQYFLLYGEEYIQQYIIMDSPENAASFEDGECFGLSINTFDMRSFYRKTNFAPGDRIVFEISDWENGVFTMERVPGGAWSAWELRRWVKLAEESFFYSFKNAGPLSSIEEQMAAAYFAGGERMRDVPAYSPEDLLLNETCKIDITPFGIESRLWYAGKDIQDYPALLGEHTQTDETPVEKMLRQNGIPISEFVLQSYLLDSIYRKEIDIPKLIEKIAPKSTHLKKNIVGYLANYLQECYIDYAKNSFFSDGDSSLSEERKQLRGRVCELHTAVIALSFEIQHGSVEKSWLPAQTFIRLSQIQNNAAAILEEFITDGGMEEDDVEEIEEAVNSMIEAYFELKDEITDSINNFRKTSISLVKTAPDSKNGDCFWRALQISIGGLEVWRRIVITEDASLEDIHKIIITMFEWSEKTEWRFIAYDSKHTNILNEYGAIRETETLRSLRRENVNDFIYEHNSFWSVKIMNMSNYEASEGEQTRCMAGKGAAPDESIEGPLCYRKLLSMMEGSPREQKEAERILGAAAREERFTVERCNQNLRSIYAGKVNL
ncbi:MAG: plasmid pRiA4b ORF-3 family protein [Spirochaetaceae bacterium]|jgi:hypothetical protein|nr:plasmid pRiA4b ORF-3 family protein [Spirochaetaceae bacterium]